ncbi:MAG: alpha/beta hydrolase, partial [Culicoidibacterales bacterium]
SKVFEHQNHQINRPDGGRLRVTRIWQKSPQKLQPAILYFHGGAFVLESSQLHTRLIQTYVEQANCTVIVVHYRLAPKHRFPANILDGELATDWLFTHASSLGIDRQKIAIAGDSAGAYIASLVCQNQQKQEQQFCNQLLIYPVLDPVQQSQSMMNFVDTPIWNAKRNAQMWANYSPKPQNSVMVSQPLQTETVAKLPPTYIEVAEFDCLHDEGVAYAQKLEAAGIDVTLMQTSETIHGYELAFSAQFVQIAIAARIHALNQGFQLEGE